MERNCRVHILQWMTDTKPSDFANSMELTSANDITKNSNTSTDLSYPLISFQSSVDRGNSLAINTYQRWIENSNKIVQWDCWMLVLVHFSCILFGNDNLPVRIRASTGTGTGTSTGEKIFLSLWKFLYCKFYRSKKCLIDRVSPNQYQCRGKRNKFLIMILYL